MGTLRVMQTFGAPRPTTNPYIVQLGQALMQEPRIEHIPFSWREALLGRIDVLHVHWADTLLAGRTPLTRFGKRVAMSAFLARIRLSRLPVVRTVHNLSEPKGSRLDRALVRMLEQRTTLRIHLTPTTPTEPGVPSIVIPHGHYVDWFSRFPKESAIPGRFGYVGLLKAYKGIDALLRAYEEARTPGISLRLAGRPADAATTSLIAARLPALRDASAELRYVSEAELVTLVTSSEIVVLPYREMHNSGAALAALSLSRPVIVPANPTNAALSDEVGQGWVLQFDGELDGDALDSALATARSTERSSAPELSRRGWSQAGALHADAYIRAAAHHPRRKER